MELRRVTKTTLAVFVALVMLMPGAVFAEHVVPRVLPDSEVTQPNPHCSDLGLSPPDHGEFKIDDVDSPDPLEEGTHTSAPFSVDIANVVIDEDEDETKEFDWLNATHPVDAVIVKAKTGANHYEYAGGATSDTKLVAPAGKGIGHIIFCYQLGNGDNGNGDNGNGDNGNGDNGNGGNGGNGNGGNGGNGGGGGNGNGNGNGDGNGAPPAADNNSPFFLTDFSNGALIFPVFALKNQSEVETSTLRWGATEVLFEASDADGDTVVLGTGPLPRWMSFDSTSGNPALGTLVGSPRLLDWLMDLFTRNSGFATLEISASDGEATVVSEVPYWISLFPR